MANNGNNRSADRESDCSVEIASDTDHSLEECKTPPKKKGKYSNKYKTEWEHSFKWLTKGNSISSARCTICSKEFSIAGQGVAQVIHFD